MVNNASVLDISKTEDLAMKRFDLMQQVNVRGTFALTRACLPYLRVSANAHVLTLSPPLNFSPHWLGAHPGYMLAKYGMTLAALGIAAEYSGAPISSNCLWPETMIATAAVGNLLGGDDSIDHSRSPEIMADAAVEILGRPRRHGYRSYSARRRDLARGGDLGFLAVRRSVTVGDRHLRRRSNSVISGDLQVSSQIARYL